MRVVPEPERDLSPGGSVSGVVPTGIPIESGDIAEGDSAETAEFTVRTAILAGCGWFQITRRPHGPRVGICKAC